MSESGWKGLFGIDVIYDEERDQFKLIEINARQPASTTYESQLQSKFRGHGLTGSTIFEAHLAALTDSPLTEKQIEINDGAQIVQRVTKTVAVSDGDTWQEKIAALKQSRLHHYSLSEHKTELRLSAHPKRQRPYGKSWQVERTRRKDHRDFGKIIF